MDRLVGRKFNVNVTQEDIDKGEWSQATKCAVAKAINRDLGDDAFKIGYDGSSITLGTVRFVNLSNDKEWRFLFHNTKQLKNWISSFDLSASNVEPIKICLDIEESVETESDNGYLIKQYSGKSSII